MKDEQSLAELKIKEDGIILVTLAPSPNTITPTLASNTNTNTTTSTSIPKPNISQPTINEPMQIDSQSNDLAFSRNLEQLLMMGFANTDSSKALRISENNINKAISLLSQPSKLASMPDPNLVGKNNTNTSTTNTNINANKNTNTNSNTTSFTAELEKLMMMGFDREQATNALLSTNGNFDHSIASLSRNNNKTNTNTTKSSFSSNSNQNATVREKQIETMVMMGFDTIQSTNALDASGGNVDKAISLYENEQKNRKEKKKKEEKKKEREKYYFIRLVLI